MNSLYCYTHIETLSKHFGASTHLIYFALRFGHLSCLDNHKNPCYDQSYFDFIVCENLFPPVEVQCTIDENANWNLEVAFDERLMLPPDISFVSPTADKCQQFNEYGVSLSSGNVVKSIGGIFLYNGRFNQFYCEVIDENDNLEQFMFGIVCECPVELLDISNCNIPEAICLNSELTNYVEFVNRGTIVYNDGTEATGLTHSIIIKLRSDVGSQTSRSYINVNNIEYGPISRGLNALHYNNGKFLFRNFDTEEHSQIQPFLEYLESIQSSDLIVLVAQEVLFSNNFSDEEKMRFYELTQNYNNNLCQEVIPLREVAFVLVKGMNYLEMASDVLRRDISFINCTAKLITLQMDISLPNPYLIPNGVIKDTVNNTIMFGYSNVVSSSTGASAYFHVSSGTGYHLLQPSRQFESLQSYTNAVDYCSLFSAQLLQIRDKDDYDILLAFLHNQKEQLSQTEVEVWINVTSSPIGLSAFLPNTQFNQDRQYCMSLSAPYYTVQCSNEDNVVICMKQIDMMDGVSEIFNGIKYFVPSLFYQKRNIKQVLLSFHSDPHSDKTKVLFY